MTFIFDGDSELGVSPLQLSKPRFPHKVSGTMMELHAASQGAKGTKATGPFKPSFFQF